MDDTLENFIDEITKKKDAIPNKINFNGLVDALNQLKEIVGLDEVKTSIIGMIKWKIVSLASEERFPKYLQKENDPEELYHTLIVGPPGSGKTVLAKIISSIYINMGLLNTSVGHTGTDATSAEPKTQEITMDIDDKELATLRKIDGLSSCLKCSKNFEAINSLFVRAKFNSEIQSKTSLLLKAISREMYNAVGRDQMIRREKILKIKRSLNEVAENCTPIALYDSTATPKTTLTTKPKFTILCRESLVGKYLGETAIKTRAALEAAMPGVVFIDETYSMKTSRSDSDSYGSESLTVINQMMTENSDKLIFIFAGYSKEIEESIFRDQPGLERRITHKFTLREYSNTELREILRRKFTKKGWIIDSNLSMVTSKTIKGGPGDIMKLFTYCKFRYGELCYSKWLDGEIIEKKLDDSLLKEAINAMYKPKEERCSQNMMFM